jgi:hypothetical protein
MAEGRSHKSCKKWLAQIMEGETELALSPAFRGKHVVDVWGWWDGEQAVGEVDCAGRGTRRRCSAAIYRYESGELVERMRCECEACSP